MIIEFPVLFKKPNKEKSMVVVTQTKNGIKSSFNDGNYDTKLSMFNTDNIITITPTEDDNLCFLEMNNGNAYIINMPYTKIKNYINITVPNLGAEIEELITVLRGSISKNT